MRLLLLLCVSQLAAAAASADQTAATTAAAATTPKPAVTAAPSLVDLFLPSVAQTRSLDGGRADVGAVTPWLASLARSLPVSYRSQEKAQSREAVSAIEEFTGPLVRFATGGHPQAADVEQLIDSIPHLARSASAIKEADKVNLSSLDFASLPPNVVAHVLRGGEIPGIDRAELDRVIQEQLKRMSETADRVLRGENIEDVEKILPPLSKVPMEMVMTSLQGKTLPGLTTAESAKIREYYTKQLPLAGQSEVEEEEEPLPEALSALGSMVKILPPGYDVGKIPPEFIQSIMAGQVPDLKLLPLDLQNHLNGGKDQAMTFVKTLNSSVSEMISQLSAAAADTKKREEHDSYRSNVYDIGKITHEVIDVEKSRQKKHRQFLYTVTWILMAVVVTLIVVLVMLYKFCMKKKPEPGALTPPARDSSAFPCATSATPPRAEGAPRLVLNSPDQRVKKNFSCKALRYSTPKNPVLEGLAAADAAAAELAAAAAAAAAEAAARPAAEEEEPVADASNDSESLGIYDTTEQEF